MEQMKTPYQKMVHLEAPTVDLDTGLPSYEMAVGQTNGAALNYNKHEAPVGPTAYNLPPPIHNGTQMAPIVQQGYVAGNTCLHPNLALNYSYDTCALVCTMILIFEFFPWGLYTLLCLDTLKNYRCTFCGYKQSRPKICLYITFMILQALFIAIGYTIYRSISGKPFMDFV